MDKHQQALEIAESVMEDGWRWSGTASDGHKLQEIVTLEYEFLKESVPPFLWPMLAERQVTLVITATVEHMAVEFAWDAPRMSPAVERAFWGFAVQAQVKELRQAEGLPNQPGWLIDQYRGNPPI